LVPETSSALFPACLHTVILRPPWRLRILSLFRFSRYAKDVKLDFQPDEFNRIYPKNSMILPKVSRDMNFLLSRMIR